AAGPPRRHGRRRPPPRLRLGQRCVVRPIVVLVFFRLRVARLRPRQQGQLPLDGGRVVQGQVQGVGVVPLGLDLAHARHALRPARLFLLGGVLAQDLLPLL